ncbi:MAG: ParB N-terminal domain-containing protein [Spirochaetales bacterium]|nr:ParB N-terminal domain-containing protein [Leptospiraceae bacterium]MCP5483057.1 ParB N-terminal domain-containing protein [Spirochaetales bacterium]MCP5486135.1 ParB N-terminal domain-containing protein [Spirochaetales bacterium]
MRIRVEDIRVRNRIRRDPGHLADLKDSMNRLGLLQPILIDPQNNLVAGFRRLQSARELGWDTIEARIIDVEDKRERLIIEAEENTTRRDFTPEELEKADRLLERYSHEGFFRRFLAWILDLFDRIFRR